MIMASNVVLKMMNDLKKPLNAKQGQIEELYSSIFDVAVDLAKYNEDKQQVDALYNSASDWAKMLLLIKGEEKIINNMRRQLDNDTTMECPDLVAHYEAEYQKLEASLPSDKLATHDFVLQMNDDVGRILYPDSQDTSEDIQLGGVQKSYICPITQTILNNPVTNECGHSYSKDVMMQYLKKNKVMKCPYGGCHANVRASTLKTNLLLEKEVKRYLADQKVFQLAGGSQPNTIEVDYDEEEME